MGSRRSHRAHGDEAPAWRRIRTIPAGYPKRRACGSPHGLYVRPIFPSRVEWNADICGIAQYLSLSAVMHQRRGISVMSVDLTDSRIDHRTETYQTMTRHLQGNILRGGLASWRASCVPYQSLRSPSSERSPSSIGFPSLMTPWKCLTQTQNSSKVLRSIVCVKSWFRDDHTNRLPLAKASGIAERSITHGKPL